MEKIENAIAQMFGEDEKESATQIQKWMQNILENRDKNHPTLSIVSPKNEQDIHVLCKHMDDMQVGDFSARLDKKGKYGTTAHISYRSKDVQEPVEKIQAHFAFLEDNKAIKRITPKSFYIKNMCPNNTIQVENKKFYVFSCFVSHPSLFANEDNWHLIKPPKKEEKGPEEEEEEKEEVLEVGIKDVPEEEDGVFFDSPSLWVVGRYISTIHYDDDDRLNGITLTTRDDVEDYKTYHEETFRYHYKVFSGINKKFQEMETISKNNQDPTTDVSLTAETKGSDKICPTK